MTAPLETNDRHADAPAQAAARNPADVIAEITAVAGGLAHELRNPLSTIMIHLRLLAEDLKDETATVEDARRRGLLRVEALQREAGRLQALFDDFLRLVGPCRLNPAPLDLRSVVRSLAEFVSPTFDRQGITLRISLPVEPIDCLGDENLLRQALLNLLLNAQQATPNGGTVTVIAAQAVGHARIAVSDEGPGVAPNERERIFRPFFSTKPGGTGLGLPICRRIAREHGGELSYSDEAGRGATFVLSIPLRCDAAS